jgi:hypothetical protein
MQPSSALTVFVLTLIALSVACLAVTSPALADSEDIFPELSMPTEHINYTIAEVNGVLWAKIDGDYPITPSQPTPVLPMCYPLPPNASNIHLYIDNTELDFSNYTIATHRTAIGDWQMITSTLTNITDKFELKIHYEHPLERANDSYLFLYDLNILSYLSPQNPTSTAYFFVHFEVNASDVHVYTALAESPIEQWQPKEFTLNSGSELAVEMHSQFGAALPGDLVIIFKNGNGDVVSSSTLQSEVPSWVIPVVLDAVFVAVIVYVKRKPIASALSKR